MATADLLSMDSKRDENKQKALDSALALAVSRPSEDDAKNLYGRLEAGGGAPEKALSSTAGIALR